MKRFFLLTLALGACMAMSSTASAQAIVDNIQEYWSFDGDLTAGIDSTFDGTFTGTAGPAQFGAGMFGQAIDLAGAASDDGVLVGGSGTEFDHDVASGGSGNVTVQAWVDAEALDQNWQAIVVNGEGDAWRLSRQGNTDNGSYAGGGPDINDAAADLTTDGFHHLVGVTDGTAGTTALYYDGTLVASGTTSATGLSPSDNPTNLGIGTNVDANGGNRNWNGLIDEVAVWDAALTADDVATLYNGGAGVTIQSLIDGGAVVPEPSSLLLGVLGFGALALRRRR